RGCSAGPPSPLKQVERDRGLVREQAEQIDLGQLQLGLRGPVEHLEYAQRALLDEQRHGHQVLWDVAGRLRLGARPARVGTQVVDDERLTRCEGPTGDPVAGREAHADQLVLSLAGDRLENELFGLLVEEEDGRGLGTEDRTRDLDRGLQERTVRLVGSDHACGDGRFEVAHAAPPAFDAVWDRTLLSWNGVRSGCLAVAEAQIAAMRGVAQLVPGQAT